ncbi:hypothetical protein PVK06_017667 [Gossypium arboreum]|uniref:DNA-directed RNA polymerase RpoA/D/Rpb3-type domain-containing protein n=1 Tax=Gossypium arboreum TaxID=29729 RepID=A0ABR0Q481_GOSAR|nr:hypothetical protein PVK06_017667 [Gossypium arboreum]
MCIRVIGASNRRYAHIGDVIVAVIKEAVPNTPLERSEVIRAVIVHTRKELKCDNRMIIRYDDNAAIVIDQEGNPKGTRIFGAITRELRQLNFTKIVLLAPEKSTGYLIELLLPYGNLLVLRRHLWIQRYKKGDPFFCSNRSEKCYLSSSRPRTDSKRLYYGCFILSPLMKGQADTIGIEMRRALLGELEGTCITRAKSEKIPHEYSNIVGIQESVHEILMNLKEIVLRGNLYGTRNAFICAKGLGYVTAQDIILPPFVEIVDNTQNVASLTEPIDLCIGLQIERNRGYGIKTPKNFHDGSYPIYVVFMPVRNVNHSIHCYGNDNEKQEILFLEIWTNGSLTPKEALHEASRNLIDLFIPFLHTEEENLHLENNQHDVTLPFFHFMID